MSVPLSKWIMNAQRNDPSSSAVRAHGPRRRALQAALVGVLCANVATVLAGILYGITALHEALTAEILGFFVYVTLTSELMLVPVGSGAGLLSCALLRRLGAVGGLLIGTVLLTILGALVGYSFTWGAPHVNPRHAILDVAAGWGLIALVALCVATWRGACQEERVSGSPRVAA